MKSFVKLHFSYAHKRLKNAVNIPMNWQKFKTLETLDLLQNLHA